MSPVPAAEDDARWAALMGAVSRGDREAFRLLYERFAPPVTRFLHRLCRDESLAEDLTQETFVRIWTAAPRWRPLGRVSTWIFQIAKRAWWKRRARRANRRSREALHALGHDAADPAEGAPSVAARRDEVARVLDALADLSPRLRLVFVLVRLEGLDYARAAEIADVRLGTLKSRMAAAEARLRRVLLGREAGGR